MDRRKHLYLVDPLPPQERKYGVFATIRSADGQHEGVYYTTGKSHAELLTHVGMFLALVSDHAEVKDIKFERTQ